MSHSLCLFQDRLEAGATAAPLRPGNRVVYAAAGSVVLDSSVVEADDAWFGSGVVAAIAAGAAGVTLWRWELSAGAPDDLAMTGAGVRSALALVSPITTLDPGDGRQWLIRCDTVAFPPGGCAYTHVHQGPGIRCLLHGTIRIDSEGHSTAFGPGDAWFEAGPEPVFAQADADGPTRFVRAMVLPRALKGQSSIRYVLDEDRDKPKTQQYRGYVDEFIEL